MQKYKFLSRYANIQLFFINYWLFHASLFAPSHSSIEPLFELRSLVSAAHHLVGWSSCLYRHGATDRWQQCPRPRLVKSGYEAAKERFRPILMTVLAMVLGLLPLMFASGAGANGSRSLASCVVGGMIVGSIALL